ncbi:TWiK family of potassium channels protein 7 [Parasteatoda tepidariorum]|nr:TWiK family of potassium channels protein 7 [Parasteatoda tepidariorum]
MKPSPISRSSMTINSIWKVRGRRPTIRRTCKVFIPRDLRELDTLRLPATYEEDHIIVQKLKAFTKHKLHHLILVIVIALYLYAGAVLFQYLDSQCSEVNLMNMTEFREDMIEKLYNDSMKVIHDLEKWNVSMKSSLKYYENKLYEYWEAGYGDNMIRREREGLSIEAAIFYCFTIITTIGYGNIVPCTTMSRAITTVYAIIGVPLMILVLADLGKLFTKVMKFIICTAKRFYKTGTFKLLKSSVITENKPLQYMTVSWRTVHPEKTTEKNDMSTWEYNYSNDQSNQVTTLTIHNDDLYKNLDFLNPDEKNHKHVEVKDDFYIPVSLAISLVIVYMIVGAFLFSQWEKWTFFEAFYFVFISMTTIGFGDYVPKQNDHLIEAFSYLILGLTLTSMSINVIQEKLTVTFQKARVRIGNNAVLNVGSLLEDEDHRSRAGQRNSLNLEDCGNITGCKMTFRNSLTVNSISQLQVKPFVKISPHISEDGTKTEFLLKVPSQHRFTFYDSPYNTIQDDDNTRIARNEE